MIEIMPKFGQDSKTPLYMQLYEHIKNEILSGAAAPGSKLPSVRALAVHLDISKNTVEGAYEQLVAEGYVKSRERSGLYVEELEGRINDKTTDTHTKNRDKYVTDKVDSLKYDFSNGQIDGNSFPYKIWRRLLNQCLVPQHKELLLYGDHQGDEDLRNEIAKYLYESRGVNCNPEQILIGSGTQQSLSMLCNMLKGIEDCIAMEEPGYVGARAVFEHYGFNVTPVRLENDGISIEGIRESRAKIAYITPSHQFPCGMVMPVAKRLKLLQWASSENSIIIEDDYDGEFRYHGKPIPSLQGLDTSGRVIYLGTFSKSLIPSSRTSYMVLPESILKVYRQGYSIYEQPVPRINQKALQMFMEQGYWERHIRRMRSIYRKKHDGLVSSIRAMMGNNVQIIGEDAGLHILLKVENGMKEEELIESARKAEVKICPTSIYCINKENVLPSTIFLGFGGIEQEDIAEGIRLLSKVWFS